jgi:hypothetical protein
MKHANSTQMGGAMVLRIRYKDDDTNDYIDAQRIQELIKEHKIKFFYRPSEKRWVNIDADQLRGRTIKEYQGEERRGLMVWLMNVNVAE